MPFTYECVGCGTTVTKVKRVRTRPFCTPECYRLYRPVFHPVPECSYPGCPDPARGLGLCSMHYQRQRNGVPLDAPRKHVVYGPLEVRFWAKVNKDSGVIGARPDLGECWTWTGSISDGGYGLFGISNGETRSAHRVGYELQVGSIPDGLDLDHLCRTRNCIRGTHLEPVTERENVMRSPIAPPAINAAKTHCIRGHPFKGDNLVIDSAGKRQCRACMSLRRARATERARQRRRAAKLQGDFQQESLDYGHSLAVYDLDEARISADVQRNAVVSRAD